MAWSPNPLTNVASGTINGTLSTIAVTYPANVSSGTKLIAALSLGVASSTTIVSVKDAALNAMTKVATTGFGTNLETSLWAMDTPAGDVGAKPTLTATVSAGIAGGMTMVIAEVAGLAVGNTLAAMVDGTAGTRIDALTPANVAYSSTAVNEFLVCVGGDAGNMVTYTIPTGGYTDTIATGGVNQASGNADVGVAYKSSTNGSEACHFTIGSVEEWGSILVAFKLSGGGLPFRSPQVNQAVKRASSW